MPESDIIAFPREEVKKKTNLWLYAAGALFIINLGLIFQPEPTPVETAKIKTPLEPQKVVLPDFERNAVAKITREVNAVFANKKSTALGPGELKLESGLVQIQFFRSYHGSGKAQLPSNLKAPWK